MSTTFLLEAVRTVLLEAVRTVNGSRVQIVLRESDLALLAKMDARTGRRRAAVLRRGLEVYVELWPVLVRALDALDEIRSEIRDVRARLERIERDVRFEAGVGTDRPERLEGEARETVRSILDFGRASEKED